MHACTAYHLGRVSYPRASATSAVVTLQRNEVNVAQPPSAVMWLCCGRDVPIPRIAACGHAAHNVLPKTQPRAAVPHGVPSD